MKRFLAAVLLTGLAAVGLHAEIAVNGVFRNDMAFTRMSNDTVFNDILENRLILQRKTDNWKFYADLRMKIYYGQAAVLSGQMTTGMMAAMAMLYPPLTNGLALPFNFGSVYFSMPRAFVKLYTGAGDVTFGKTYVNFGILGVLNPLEMNKTINFSDLSYDKEGILAVDYKYPLGSLAGGELYVNPQYPLSNTAGGGSLFFHVGTFDLGLVLNRKEYNRTVAGAYFKGDLELGVHGGYAYHFDDWFTNNFSEANIGIDYSFFEGKLIASVDAYWADIGAESTNDYNKNTEADKYFLAKYYLYGNLSCNFNEFIGVSVDCFVNLIDGSGLVLPSLKYTVFDGLYLTLLVDYIWSDDKNKEFSSERYGIASALMRVEAKL